MPNQLPADPGAPLPSEPTAQISRFRDPSSGVLAEVRTDGVPVGLAIPETLLSRHSEEIAGAVLRALVAAAAGARELLETLAEEDWTELEEDTERWQRAEARI